MKRLNVLRILILSFILAYSTTSAQISSDAVQLTIRQQQSGYWIDSSFALRVDSLLIAARATADTLNYIHTFTRIVPNKIDVYSTGSWTNNWRNGNIWTGVPAIDSLGQLFNLVLVIAPPYHNWYFFTLIFGQELFTPGVAEAYKNLTHIIDAYSFGMGGDGNDIHYFYKYPDDYLVFSRGWGDCPSGCINRYYWYVEVKNENGQYTGTLVEERLREPIPILYRWNVPDYYAMTMFSNHNEILDSIKHANDWWVRRHAIEGTWRFFVYNHAWAFDTTSVWNYLKVSLKNSVSEVLSTLNTALNDEDEFVRLSAQAAIDTILRVTSIDYPVELPNDFMLYQNYPNPFNPVTTIGYQIPDAGYVTLKVYDVLGREVATLVNEERPVGKHEVNLDASQLASGVYYYQIRINNFIHTKKMILNK